MDPIGTDRVGTPHAASDAGRVAALLASQGIFSTLERDALQQIVEAGRVESMEPGSTVMRRGERGTQVLCLLDGRVRVEAEAGGGRPVSLDVLEPIEILGEMAVLQGRERSATVTAVEPCTFFVLDERDFLAVLHANPEIGIQLLRALSRRVDRLTQAVAARA